MQVRDMKVLEGVEKHRYLRTDQAAELYFQEIKNPVHRVNRARNRLLMLYRQKLLKRARFPGEHFIYFTRGTTRSHKMQHYLAVTDVLLQLLKKFPASSKIEYDIEMQRDNVITDLVINYRNEWRGEKRTYYVEVELDSTGNLGQKISAYEEIIEGDDVLLIVCKHYRIARKIETENYMIPLMVSTLDNIQELKLFASNSLK